MAHELQFRAQDYRCVSALVVDDCLFDRRRLQRLLRGTNKKFMLQECSSIADLDNILESVDLDIVFTDFDMPDGNGHDVLIALKKSQLNANVGCIMITGTSCPKISTRALELNCLDCFHKDSLRRRSLIDAINRILESKRRSKCHPLSYTEESRI